VAKLARGPLLRHEARRFDHSPEVATNVGDILSRAEIRGVDQAEFLPVVPCICPRGVLSCLVPRTARRTLRGSNCRNRWRPLWTTSATTSTRTGRSLCPRPDSSIRAQPNTRRGRAPAADTRLLHRRHPGRDRRLPRRQKRRHPRRRGHRGRSVTRHNPSRVPRHDGRKSGLCAAIFERSQTESDRAALRLNPKCHQW
jgi:hypothetical protein